MRLEASGDPLVTYLAAAKAFADLVTTVESQLDGDLVDAWGGPGLGDWDLRALVGHTSRSLVTVSEYLRQPADRPDLDSAEAYYVVIDGAAAAPGVTERGIAAGAALGEDPPNAVRRLVQAVVDDLAGADLDGPVTTFAGAMRLRDYLPTRTLELVVHGLDIAAAAPVDWTPPADALAESVHLAADVALARGEGSLLLRLVTGREPGGLSVV